MNDFVLKEALQRWGVNTQMVIAIEECSELTHEITKYLRGRPSNLAEEIADVKIMLRQLEFVAGEDNVAHYVDEKIYRLQERLGRTDIVERKR